MSPPSRPARPSSPPASSPSPGRPPPRPPPAASARRCPTSRSEAENAATNGAVIGPSADYNTLAGEASYRKAVTLTGQGKYVEFTTPAATNSIVFRYSIPDTAQRLGVHGAALAVHQRRPGTENSH